MNGYILLATIAHHQIERINRDIVSAQLLNQVHVGH